MKTVQKTNTKRSVRRIMLVTILALAVLFAGLYAASRTFARVQLSNLADVFVAFSAKDDSAFPYAVDAGCVVRMVPFGSGIAVLRTDKLDILTKSGAVLQSLRHTYTSPAVDECAGRILLYDRGGTRYMILSKTGVLCSEAEADAQILTAALRDDGSFALATTTDGAKSLLTVYTSRGEPFFRYKCISEYVTDVAFTHKGAALTVGGVKNAETYSRLLALSFKKTEPLMDLSYAETTLFHVYGSGGVVTACSRDLFTRVDSKARQEDTRFDSDVLQFFCTDASGKATLVLQTYGNEHETHLKGLDRSGKEEFDVKCGEKLRAASRSGSYSGVLTDSSVLTYNNNGALVGTLTLTESAQDVCLSERTAYVLFPDRIERFHAAGTHTQAAE